MKVEKKKGRNRSTMEKGNIKEKKRRKRKKRQITGKIPIKNMKGEKYR